MDENISDPLPPVVQPPAAPRRGPWDWLKEQPDFPSVKRAAPERHSSFARQFLYRWFRPSLFLSTWLILLLAAAALMLLEIPGRRTGFTTYSHGWPLTYLTRDYRQELHFLDDDRWTIQGWIDGFCGKRWIDTDLAATDRFQEGYARDGFPLTIERQMTPWSVSGVTSLNQLAGVVDIGLAILLLIAVGWAAQRWRRRRIAAGRRLSLQFRLRTFLLAAMIVDPTLGITLSWFHEYRADRLILDELSNNSSNGWSQVESHWLPPPGVPESLLKIGPIAPWFERVDTLYVDRFSDSQNSIRSFFSLTPQRGVQFNVDTASKIMRLRKLRRMSADNIDFTESGLVRLAEASSISELSLKGIGITAAGVTHLVNLPRLTTLQLESFGLNDDAIEQLNRLRSLEELTLWRNTATRFQLHDLERLQSLYIDCFGGQHCIDTPICPQNPFDEVASMKPGEAPKDGFWHPEIHLENLPRLKHVFLDGVTLSKRSADEINRLPAIETLLMTECEAVGPVSLALEDHDALRSAMFGGAAFSDIRLQNLPRLGETKIWNSERLTTLHLAHVPRLTSIQLDNVPSLSQLFLTDAANVQKIALAQLHSFGPTYGPPLTRFPGQMRAARLELRGLAGAAKLHHLELPGRKLDAVAFDEIGSLTGLTSLDLSGTWLSDSDLARLKSLANLERLDLSGTDITADGLDALSNMPRLELLRLTNTFVVDSDEGLKRLQSSHPGLAIEGTEFSEVDDVLEHAVESANNGQGGATSLWCQPSWIPSTAVMDRTLACLDVLDRLPALNLWGCHVTDAGLEHVKKLTHLQALNLDRTHISSAGLAKLAGLKSLASLSLADTLVDGSGLKQLQQLPALKSLDLSGCDITDDDLANLKFLPNIERLWLAGTKISDAGLAHVALLPKLRSLDLSQTGVTDAGLVRLESLSQLESLGLRDCSIQGSGIAHLLKLEHLLALNLSNAPLDDAGLEQLARLSQLHELVLEGIVVPAAIKSKLPALKQSGKAAIEAAAVEPKWPGLPKYGSLEQRQREELHIREAFWSGLFPPGGNQLPSRPRD